MPTLRASCSAAPRRPLPTRQVTPTPPPARPASTDPASIPACAKPVAAVAAAVAATLTHPSAAAAALTAHPEPANALSLPTWAIHVSSVAEWAVAMVLFWRLADATGIPEWRSMTWGMIPLLGGALAACSFHFFYNDPTLYPLVAIQAGLTTFGNATLALAAWHVWSATKELRRAEEEEKRT